MDAIAIPMLFLLKILKIVGLIICWIQSLSEMDRRAETLLYQLFDLCLWPYGVIPMAINVIFTKTLSFDCGTLSYLER